ncbi:hypothetical protein SEUCBS140593_003677 [Sporothrix eucalyptigena]|uniref:ABM domain-containing protein n=1 Tax=Sporothrix eucalyptigena TaxID=1812306 RepID=A0ABP0BH39_9PEZI
MTVTEFGVTKTSGAIITPEFRTVLENALASQTKWLKIDPAASGVNAVTGGRAWLYQQIEDPASALLAATWTDVDQHNSWAATDPERDTLLPAIGKHLHQPSEADPTPPVILVHADGDLLSPEATPAGKGALVDSPVISITRLFVTPGKKAEFEAALNAAKDAIAEYTAPNTLQGSWRVDKESPEKEEFVLVAGWESKEKHLAIAETGHLPKLAAFTSLTDGRESRHYKRLL